MSSNEVIFNELQLKFSQLKKDSVKPQQLEDKLKEQGDASDTAKATQVGLQELIERIDETFSTLPKDDEAFIKLLSMKASLLYETAKISLSLNDYVTCQVFLERALKIIEDLDDHSQITYLYMRLMNHYAYVMSRQGKLKKSKEVLEKITSLTPAADVKVYSTEELFSNSDIDQSEAPLKMYRLTINNLQMLGWVCSKMGLDDEYAAKQHTILEYQLTYGECDPVDWASRCARLAVFYMSKYNWVAARYHLSTACSMLDQLERDMVPHPELGKAQAEISRSWIYYGIRLFNYSKTAETSKRCNDVLTGAEDNPEATDLSVEEKLDPSLLFHGCLVKLEDMPAITITTSEQARILFFQTHIWLKRARMFYTLRDHPYIYVNCILDLSELYRYLAFFEPDLEAQYNVQKRRADALESLSGLLKDVRPQCYISVSVEILRELAEVHLELMGLNLKRMYQVQGVPESEEDIKKRMEAISDIHSRLESFGGVKQESGEFPSDVAQGTMSENTEVMESKTENKTDDVTSEGDADNKVVEVS